MGGDEILGAKVGKERWKRNITRQATSNHPSSFVFPAVPFSSRDDSQSEDVKNLQPWSIAVVFLLGSHSLATTQDLLLEHT